MTMSKAVPALIVLGLGLSSPLLAQVAGGPAERTRARAANSNKHGPERPEDDVPSSAPILRVHSQVRISPPSGGRFPLYQIAGDPENPKNLIACGSLWNAHDNAMYGFLFASSDGGQTWQPGVEDKNSLWVTEQSCAFGTKGRAYFVSEASKVIDGATHHALGTTRIFVTNDAGRSWTEAAQTTWADYTTSVVNTRGGADQNRLFTFSNDLFLHPGKDEETRPSDWVSALTFDCNGGENRVSQISGSSMSSLGYLGALPQSAFQLNDGSLLTVFSWGHRTERGYERVLSALSTTTDRKALQTPVDIYKTITLPKNAGTFNVRKANCFGDTAAYDSTRNELFVAYLTDDDADGKCHFKLTSSADGGHTWSPGGEIPRLETLSHSFHVPAMAFNREGILGLMWRDELDSDCWYFAASADRGQTFTRAQALSQCLPNLQNGPPLSAAGLRFGNTVRIGDLLDYKQSHQALGISLVDDRNAVWRYSLTATSDGAFHPAWIEAGNGEGQLRTAVVTVGGSERIQAASVLLPDKDARDITQDVTLLYGGDQYYDTSAGTLTIRVVLKNKSQQPVRVPLFLKVLSMGSPLSDAPELEIANASNGQPGAGAIWDLSGSVPNGILGPGATSESFPIVFRINRGGPRKSLFLQMPVQVLTTTSNLSDRVQ